MKKQASRRSHRVLAIFLCFVFCLSLLPASVFAYEGETASGEGWSIDADGCLHLYGRTNDMGWRDLADDPMGPDDFRYDFTSVVVESGTELPTCQELFANRSSLQSVDLTGLDTSGTTSMSDMFKYCYNLTSLTLTGLNTANVTDMSGMFSGCSSLTTLSLTGLNTANVTNMSGMFSGCSSLSSLPLTGLNTANVTDMSNMFYYCSALTSLDVSGFNTAKVTSMQSMFDECSSLTTLTGFENFSMAAVTDVSYLFHNCSKLNVSAFGFNCPNLTNMQGTFFNCGTTGLDFTGFSAPQLNNISYLFGSCYKLTSLDLRSFNTSACTNFIHLFYGCVGLTSLDISGFDTENVSNCDRMFLSVSKLQEIRIGEKTLRSDVLIDAILELFPIWTNTAGGTFYTDAAGLRSAAASGILTLSAGIPVDTDGDGVIDAAVTVSDPDGDGVLTDSEGTPYIPVDTDSDGSIDLYAAATAEDNGGYSVGVDGFFVPVDTDNDGKADSFVPAADNRDGSCTVTLGDYVVTASGSIPGFDGKTLNIEKAGAYTLTMKDGAAQTAQNILVSAPSGSVDITLGGVSVEVADGLTDVAALEIVGGCSTTLILADGSSNSLTACSDSNCASIQNNQHPLTITCEHAGERGHICSEACGSLTAPGRGNGAGIGGGRNQCGENITIAGGNITTWGGMNGGAGIGGGTNASCSNVVISGGDVDAYGGDCAAGIGGGVNSSGAQVTITGGTVKAGSGATAAIGSFSGGDAIVITGGSIQPTWGIDMPAIGGAVYGEAPANSITLGTTAGLKALYYDSESGIFTDSDGRPYIGVDTDGDGIADSYIGVTSDTPDGGCVYTGTDGLSYRDNDGDGIFTPAVQDADGNWTDITSAGDGTYKGSDGNTYISVADGSGSVALVPVDGKAGDGIYRIGSDYYADFDGDGVFTPLVKDGVTYTYTDAQTGGMREFADLDGDGTLEELTYIGIGCWQYGDDIYADPDGDGKLEKILFEQDGSSSFLNDAGEKQPCIFTYDGYLPAQPNGDGSYTTEDGRTFVPTDNGTYVEGIVTADGALVPAADPDGDGVYTDDEGGSYIGVDIDGDGKADGFVPVTGPDASGRYTGETGIVYQADPDHDGVFNIIAVNEENEGTAITDENGDGIYTDSEGNTYIGADTDRDGKTDSFVPVERGDADGIYTDGEGGTYIAADADGDGEPDGFVRLTDDDGDGIYTDGEGNTYIGIDTDKNGKPDVFVPVDDGDGDGVYTDGEGDTYIGVDTDRDGRPDMHIPAAEGADGTYQDSDGHRYQDPDGDGVFTRCYEGSIDLGGGADSAKPDGYADCARDGGCRLADFTDLKPDAWYHDGLHYCLANGLLCGVSDTLFAPDEMMTRAQAVTVLWRLAGCPAAAGADFADVAADAWYAGAVAWATSTGIVKGYGNGCFGPDDFITREQLAAFLYSYAQYKGIDTSASADLNAFADADAVSDWAEDAMSWAVGAGILDASAPLNAAGYSTRAQLAGVMLLFGTLLLQT